MLDAILGSGLATPPTPEERAQLKRIIRLRTCLWSVAGLWLAVSFASLAFGFDSAVVGGGLIVVWFILGVRLGQFTPCPRCGEQFHAKGFFGGRLFTQSCVHCGFALRPPAGRA
jgi:hypothetical protein